MEIFQNVNNQTQTLCQILRMVIIKIAINSTHGAQQCNTCRYCIAFEVVFLVSSLLYFVLLNFSTVDRVACYYLMHHHCYMDSSHAPEKVLFYVTTFQNRQIRECTT